MTREEAILIFKDVRLSECYFQCSAIKDSCDAYDMIYGQRKLEVIDFMLDRIMEMPMSFEDAQNFFDDCAEYATMDNERTGDDFDNIIFYDNDIAIWTEVLGRTYSASKFGKTWKFYERSRKELDRLASRDEAFLKDINDTLAKWLPKLEAAELTEVKPMSEVWKND